MMTATMAPPELDAHEVSRNESIRAQNELGELQKDLERARAMLSQHDAAVEARLADHPKVLYPLSSRDMDADKRIELSRRVLEIERDIKARQKFVAEHEIGVHQEAYQLAVQKLHDLHRRHAPQSQRAAEALAAFIEALNELVETDSLIGRAVNEVGRHARELTKRSVFVDAPEPSEFPDSVWILRVFDQEMRRAPKTRATDVGTLFPDTRFNTSAQSGKRILKRRHNEE
jgi:hypothetical protein